MSDIQDAVEAARETRLAETQGSANPVDPLLGECQKNAAAIRDELRERGISCRVVGGALKNAYRDDELPSSFAEAKTDGIGIHYWVESQGHICELASECGQAYGDLLVIRSAPEELGYIRFEDSYNAEVPY